jgi:4-hydroxyphenylacetate 3-monooxygenase
VKETSDGIIVRGAKALATSAAVCNENLSLAIGTGPMQDDEKHYALGFAHPVDATGVRWICRDPMIEDSLRDHPLAGRIDEMDCLCVYDDAFIPWDRVFVYQDLAIQNRLLSGLHFSEAFGHHALVRAVTKTRLLFGVAHLIAETSRIHQFVNVQDKLGEMLVDLWTLESLVATAVDRAEVDARGIWHCNSHAIQAGLRLHAEWYPRMVHIIQQLGSSGFMAAPQSATLDALGPAIETYFRGAERDASDRVQLFRLAWDLVGHAWGGRQSLYERCFGGDAERVRASLYVACDKTEAVAIVSQLLDGSLRGDPTCHGS